MAKAAKERIGILGGTFNPIHQGHIAMALSALQGASLSRVLLLPDRVPPHKTGIAPAEDRWRMVCAAAVGYEGLEPSRIELDREGTTYTFDTLTALREQNLKAELYYIIGTDTLMELRNWHRWREVLGLCTFLVCPRKTEHAPASIRAEQTLLEGLGGHFRPLTMDMVDISSTELRTALAEDQPTALLSPAVRAYCHARGLYGMTEIDPHSEAWMERLFRDLTVKRFAHTLGVTYTARNLARIHHVDVRKAEIAALLHDSAKCLPLKDMQKIALDHALTSDKEVLSSGALLHSIAGAWLAANVYGVQDPEILRAISCHTTGKVGMTPLDMLVYLADKIEPGRPSYPLLDKVCMMAPLSLERALLASMNGTVDYVRSKGKPVHHQTLETLAWLKTLPEVSGRTAEED